MDVVDEGVAAEGFVSVVAGDEVFVAILSNFAFVLIRVICLQHLRTQQAFEPLARQSRTEDSFADGFDKQRNRSADDRNLGADCR